jgi:formamidopyrimidine-DNA glycosylase
MPELPEVETVVRGLRVYLMGRTITKVTVRWPGSIGAPDPDSFVQQLTGRTVADVGRRGKWIVIELDDGQILLVHLRMTGQLVLKTSDCGEGERCAYTRVVFHLDEDPETSCQQLRFSDMRKFGRLILTPDPDDVLGELGPEPLADDFTAERFEHMLARRRGRVKSLLLNQRFLVGLGNIYVNEALWQARVHPLRSARSLSSEEVERLHRAIRSVLRAAIKEGGTTLENGNFRQANGEAGEFAGQLLVYDRQGEPCECCGAAIERIVVGQRGTYYCPRCQPPSMGE